MVSRPLLQLALLGRVSTSSAQLVADPE